jgi:hypothetical protein
MRCMGKGSWAHYRRAIWGLLKGSLLGEVSKEGMYTAFHQGVSWQMYTGERDYGDECYGVGGLFARKV